MPIHSDLCNNPEPFQNTQPECFCFTEFHIYAVKKKKKKRGEMSGAELGVTDKMEAQLQHPLFVPQAQTQDEGVRPFDSDFFFYSPWLS